ncbi:MAG: N-6 DNA methylase [Bacteroidetes bacterium]|nr:N-6 DNA methylase [Bacteroidota bacterium]
MGRSTVHYADNKTNNALKKLHNKLRPAGTPVQRVEYIIELLLLRIFETKIKQDEEFKPLRKLFSADYKWKNPKKGADAPEETNENRLFSYLPTVSNDQILSELNDNFFPFYSSILISARQVFEGNLPQKVQDQLVLIEEVFSNSNFTNNVNSGNLGEVISIVANDIEETRLLKTDLLGDAIESALSETGGTKDVGLFRTPDHIRQFMTAMIEPTFDDIIFDPACGTGGFLFDAFEFVMRRVDPDREWPGEKSHSELSAWFDEYFKSNQLDFPSIEQTTQFYRSGVTGIEYLGMIRKMAAINFYVRGLNPANIEQGDSLAKYRPVTDHESKSVILANPPFGAQRDQESYPDVWGEYSKESETTILFVKLMFEQLKAGGKCAVVVSEGFHTWDQFSAKALRKMLLDEAQLKAVISLPQGLFVSKSGQGPKTSILIFEKGASANSVTFDENSQEKNKNTQWVWFYKITNDGYTMGTNRKEQKGNQLIECLTLWHEYVKHGKQPPESKNQFCIPAEWIKTLDPRIKEKIRTETRADMEAKGKIEREKKEADLDKKIKAKKATEADKSMELKTFDQMLENRIQNEIAKRIDKAHTYSFNLANYKSTISDSQIVEWTDALKHIQPNGATTVEEVYKKLTNSKPENILPYLVKLNPSNALEADIAREYVSNLDNDLISKHKELNVIKEILKSKQKYPSVKLKDVLTEYHNFIQIDDEKRYKQLTVSNTGEVKLRDIVKGEEIATKRQNQIIDDGSDYLIYSRLGLHTGSIGFIPFGLIDSIVSTDFPVFKSNENIKYLAYVLQSKIFVNKIIEKNPTGAAQQRFHQDDFLEFEIPVPTLDEQNVIVSQIEKQRAIIEGVEKIENNFDFSIPESQDKRTLNTFIKDSLYGLSVKLQSEGKYPVLRMNNLDTLGRWHLDNLKYTDDKLSKERLLEFGDFIFNRTNSVDLVGKSSVVDFEMEGSWAGYLIRLKLKEALNPFFLKYLFTTKRYREYFKRTCKPAGGQANINADELGAVSIDYFDPEIQKQIVAELDAQMEVLKGLVKMKTEAQRKINQILADVWGVEFLEPENILVEDEQEN